MEEERERERESEGGREVLILEYYYYKVFQAMIQHVKSVGGQMNSIRPLDRLQIICKIPYNTTEIEYTMIQQRPTCYWYSCRGRSM